MKKIVIFTLALALLLTACSAPVAVEDDENLSIDDQVVSAAVVDGETIDTLVNAPAAEIESVGDAPFDGVAAPLAVVHQLDAPVGELTAVEIEGLLYMREEEKLARDVYLTLYEQWNARNFQNIARSEATHMDAILTLLEGYGLEDPAAGKDIGEFTNPELAALYNQLVAQGGVSLSEALKVGAAIEEIDILDLEEYMAQTDDENILTVYETLLKGSRNHLRAFTRVLQQRTGEAYSPVYLSPDSYAAIVGTRVESGGNGGGNRGGNRNRGS